jgi:hypothetical protein
MQANCKHIQIIYTLFTDAVMNWIKGVESTLSTL